MRNIVLLTDFGEEFYVGVMKGVINKIVEASIIDLEHNVKPQNIVEGSFILSVSYRFFPKNSVFVVVIDPSVGSKRQVLVVKAEEYFFVGPDNGIFSFLFNRASEIYKLDIPKFLKKFIPWKISNTFHGRDIFAPLGAWIYKDMESLKPFLIPVEKNKLIWNRWWEIETMDRRLKGRVVHIDRFGNVITNFPCELRLRYIEIKGVKIKNSYSTFSDAPFKEPFFYCGSSGYYEIALREDNFALKFSIDFELPVYAEEV